MASSHDQLRHGEVILWRVRRADRAAGLYDRGIASVPVLLILIICGNDRGRFYGWTIER